MHEDNGPGKERVSTRREKDVKGKGHLKRKKRPALAGVAEDSAEDQQLLTDLAINRL